MNIYSETRLYETLSHRHSVSLEDPEGVPLHWPSRNGCPHVQPSGASTRELVASCLIYADNCARFRCCGTGLALAQRFRHPDALRHIPQLFRAAAREEARAAFPAAIVAAALPVPCAASWCALCTGTSTTTTIHAFVQLRILSI